MNWNDILDFAELSVLNKHKCEKNEDEDTAILYCKSSVTGFSNWILANVWIAGNEEVEDGEADEIGEIKKLTTITISYCPFCGDLLRL